MEVKQFRIGNLVYKNSCGSLEVEEVTHLKMFMEIDEINNYNPIYYLPIPLDEDHVFNLGIINNEIQLDNGDKIQIDINNNTVWLGGCDSCIDGHGFTIENVKYLHQLQNICFDLTGIELIKRSINK